jgi:hypothetical protein
MAGYDTANYIYDVYKDADGKYGTPDFWIRYFNPNKNVPFTTNAVAESRAAWDSGGGHIGPISSPGTGRLGTDSSAAGFADGQVFGAGLQSATESVSQLKLPSNGVMYCWLDMEPGDILRSNYWDGWRNPSTAGTGSAAEATRSSLRCTPGRASTTAARPATALGRAAVGRSGHSSLSVAEAYRIHRAGRPTTALTAAPRSPRSCGSS